MKLLPAIDIKDGQCVRLYKGDMDNAKTYFTDPAEAASRWLEAGAEMLHVVNLNGAVEGRLANRRAIEDILAVCAACGDIPVQLGGGIRSMEALDEIMVMGVTWAVLGTAALEDETFLRQALAAYGERIVVGIDAKDGKVAVDGWLRTSSCDAFEFASAMSGMGVERIVYTDISKDGTMSGPNFEATARMVRESGLKVTASGGITTMEDLQRLKREGSWGAVLGKSLYEGTIDLAEALKEVG